MSTIAAQQPLQLPLCCCRILVGHEVSWTSPYYTRNGLTTFSWLRAPHTVYLLNEEREPVTASKDTLNEEMLRAALFPLALVALHQLLLFAVRKEYTVHESGGIVVTGASTGIGRHAALALAKEGYVVYAGCLKVHATACQA